MCYQQLNSAVPVARKEHVCDECRRTIKRGRQYRRSVGIAEGDFSVGKHCLRCAALIALAYDQGPYSFGECFFPGEIRTTIRDYVDMGWRALRAKLRERARQRKDWR